MPRMSCLKLKCKTDILVDIKRVQSRHIWALYHLFSRWPKSELCGHYPNYYGHEKQKLTIGKMVLIQE